MEYLQQYIGIKFNRLTILEDLGVFKKKRYCNAKCECGVVRKYAFVSIKDGATKSCGCLRIESNKIGHHRTHGGSKHALYGIWADIKKRCYNEKCLAYKSYGAKGVVMCDEWKNDFKKFYDWCIINGWKEGLELDKDKLSPNRKGLLYSPKFCCFITRKENLMYKSNSVLLAYKEEVRTLSEWCELLTLNIHLVRNRLRNGKSVSEAFNIPVNIKKRNNGIRIHSGIPL